MNKNIFFTALSIASLSLIMSNCAEYETYSTPLSISIFALADNLMQKNDCSQKSDYLHQWLDKNASKTRKLKKSFDKECSSGNVVCLSYHILSSAQIEVALRECRTSQKVATTLKSDVAKLNDLAGISVRF